ncbi:MAG: pyrroline-5-carboxylate reductase [Bryobacterales bacterium]|nr:pyrroline-5-carboxylate reductase [Bryobacterales bacterium]
MVSVSPRYAVLGAGNIGSAVIGGMLKSGIAVAEQITATVKSEEHAGELAEQFNIRVLAGGNLAAVETADVVILAVKPSVMPAVLQEIRWSLRDGRILISLAAAFPIALIEHLTGRRMPVFRAMPNIPCVVGTGATGIAYNALATEEHKEFVSRIFSAIGVVCFVEEDLLHAVTALSGSGPAYIYMVIEALIAGGLKQGLSHEVSTRLAEQTVLGAAKLVKDTGLHPAILRDQVITPGGVTISAIHELEAHGLRSMLISAVETATEHSRTVTNKIMEKNQNTNE